MCPNLRLRDLCYFLNNKSPWHRETYEIIFIIKLLVLANRRVAFEEEKFPSHSKCASTTSTLKIHFRKPTHPLPFAWNSRRKRRKRSWKWRIGKDGRSSRRPLDPPPLERSRGGWVGACRATLSFFPAAPWLEGSWSKGQVSRPPSSRIDYVVLRGRIRDWTQ